MVVIANFYKNIDMRVFILLLLVLCACTEQKKPFPIRKINAKETALGFRNFYIKEFYKAGAFANNSKIDTSNQEGILQADERIQYELKISVYSKPLLIALDSAYEYANSCLLGDTLHLAVTYFGRSEVNVLYYTFFTQVNDTLFNEVNLNYYYTQQKPHTAYACKASRVFVDLGHPFTYFRYIGKEKRSFVTEISKAQSVSLGFVDYQAYFRFVRLPNDSAKLDDMALFLQ